MLPSTQERLLTLIINSTENLQADLPAELVFQGK